ncbi:type VI secretion system Vgr family protein [Hymenobacter weizhouensis]|uniref:type VI secretion system Vgr family protein n=1 Tax=Hymenobacter sp. YIM 151500-1 TaxID=2987689 RepID=UPI0022268906|nr:type VI secretion system tip protein VgrG [Hymenobacter sp. YIM 151500-1]UYZ64938.1 type VI secretion system tip protein VgrG [Hymenobacter sp. YIM 151500-1]
MARQITLDVRCAGRLLAPGTDFYSFTLHQSLFAPHALTLHVPFDHVEGPLTSFLIKAPEQLLSQPVEVVIEADEAFYFNQRQTLRFKGLVAELSTGQDSDYSSSVRIQAYSPCFLLSDGLQKRTFVNQTLTAIFTAVLQPYPGNLLARSIKPTHQAPLPYVVQYEETNYAFLSRLAAEYGEWFYYDGTTLRLGAPASSEAHDFEADGEWNGFHFGLALRPTRAVLYDYDYQQHQHHTGNTASQQVPGLQQHRYGQVVLDKATQLFQQPMHASAEVPGATSAQLNDEAKAFKANRAADLVRVQGYSDQPALQLGGVLSIRGKGFGTHQQAGESFGTYRIIDITHHVDAQGNYRNSFTAIPHVVDIPPVNPHQLPPHGTPELAEVIDDNDPQKLGRLKVRYHWPVENKKAAETDWLRVLTPYSGNGKGHLMKPEVGSQVLIGYHQNLAEQPVVLGNLFHAQNPQGASYSPTNNGLKGIQTAGGNKFVMLDTAGAQSILISNSNKKDTAILISFQGDGSIDIKTNGPINLTAGKDITLQSAKNITLQADESISLIAKKKVSVQALEEDVALRAQKEMLLTAVSGDLTLEAAAKKTMVKAANNVEVTATGLVKLNGSDVKLNG